MTSGYNVFSIHFTRVSRTLWTCLYFDKRKSHVLVRQTQESKFHHVLSLYLLLLLFSPILQLRAECPKNWVFYYCHLLHFNIQHSTWTYWHKLNFDIPASNISISLLYLKNDTKHDFRVNFMNELSEHYLISHQKHKFNFIKKSSKNYLKRIIKKNKNCHNKI